MRMCYKKKNKIVKKISLNYFYKIKINHVKKRF